METQELIFTNHVAQTIDSLVDTTKHPQVFVLVDTNTSDAVLPRLQAMSQVVSGAKVITVSAGDSNKNLDSLIEIWKKLSDNDGTRRSLMINLGGGMVTDIGSFAASTFKRGISFINVPTTLLGAVDASVGGKTGINFNGLKNEIGLFRNAEVVIISTEFFNTLSRPELRSGYAEMLKHGLISSKEVYDKLISQNVEDLSPDALLELLKESVTVKSDIVAADPEEHGIRRSLNLGHTIGHAFEEFALERESPIAHGYAVVWGLVAELVLSNMRAGFPGDELHRFAAYVAENYGGFSISCEDYPRLIELMGHDKKNDNTDEINFTLLHGIGDYEINCIVPSAEIEAALDIYRDLLHV